MNTSVCKKSIAGILILVMILALFPSMTIQTKAEEATSQLPVLNQTIVGTVKFQSFNFLGDNSTGEDGTDYSTTFYYSDDYFSASAINDAATSKTMLWSDLENPSLATCSMDLAVAAYTSAEGDVTSVSSQTWNNSDYSDKDKNVKQFLGDCGFTDIEPHALTERPTNDSIGYTLGSKNITVWNEDTQKNETYTLIAVGVRGAGYGAEWASNITIGNPATGALGTNKRHYGFDHSAQIVCDGIRDYLNNHSITGKVKYWVSGFSRAAAVANLVAGYLTDDGRSYRTQQKDVYGYTWECPQAASTINDNALNYKNIHNIINPMDAVPKVSPDAFEHQRLGVDYQMPYHDSVGLSSAEHIALYNQMFEVLKEVAVGNGTDPDPLVDDKSTSTKNDGYVSPNKYPYNRPMTIYKMDGSELMGQVVNYGLGTDTETLLKEFGTVEAHDTRYTDSNFPYVHSANVKKLLYKYSNQTEWYIDDFINNLVTVFLTSNAWVGGTGTGRTALQNRDTFISRYQSDFRTLFGYFLDFTGPAFLSVAPKLIDAVTSNIGTSLTSGFAWDFVRFYNDPTNTTKKNNLINSSKTLAVDVANDMVKGFPDPEYQGITKSQMNTAMQNLAELVVNLYAYELSEYDSQYLGTTLRYLNTILCTHEQETVLSWIMSLDENHVNRSYRTLTVPKKTDVKLYEFREQYANYDGTLSTNGKGALVAEYTNGAVVKNLDQRISLTSDGTNMTIRYPSTLDIRLDISAMNDDTYYDDVAFQVADYRTNAATTAISDGYDQYDPQKTNAKNYTPVAAANTNASTINGYNSLRIPLSCHDVLQIMANGTTTYDNSATADKHVYDINKLIYANTVVEGQFVKENGVETYYPYVTDISGKEKQASEIEAEVSYSSTRGNAVTETGKGNEIPSAHVGNSITATLPVVDNDNQVEKYFVTDSRKENNRKLSDNEAVLPDDLITETTDNFVCSTGSSTEEILSSEDKVYHVYYAGDLSGSFTLVYQDGTEEPIKIDRAYQGIDITERVRGDMMYGGLFEDAAFKIAAKTPGTKLIPTVKKYYIKEVPKTYFYTRNIATTQGGQVRGSYAVAVADDPNYQEVGFIYNGQPIPSIEKDGESSLYESVTFNNLQSHYSKTFIPKDLMDDPDSTSTDAVIAIARVDTIANGKVQAYWITADGVKVVGDNIRTLENGRKPTTIPDDIGRYEISKDKITTVYESAMPVNSIYVANDEEDEPISTDFGVKLAGYTTSLNGNIAMNFYVDVSDDVAADENAYMQFTLPGANTTAEKVMLSDATKQTRDGKTYYVFSAGVAAKEMTSDIKAQFVKGDGTKSPEWTYTIKEYCDYIRSHEEEYDAESVALAENMLLYGGNAQKYFKYNLDKLADVDVNVALPEVNLDASFDPVVKGSCEGLTYLGSSAMLTTTTGLRHYFTLAGNARDYTFTANGKKLTVESDKNGKYVLIDNIKAKDLKKPITLKVTDKAGNEFSLTYSVYTNIKQVLNGDFAAADKNLMKALYGYGEAAEDYFASR